MSAIEFLKFCISWGHTESSTSGKSSLNVFIHAVYISSCVNSDHYMVLVGSLGMFGDWEFKVLSLWSPGGFNIVNCLKHIYPWWIWLSHSNFIDGGVTIILGWCLEKIGSLGPFLGLAYLVEVSYFVTVLALCILSWTFLSWLVLCFPHLMHFPSIPGGFLG